MVDVAYFIDVEDRKKLFNAMRHFIYLDDCGSLTREEEEHIELFRKLLLQALVR